MKRLFYLSVGVAAGVYLSRRLARTAQAWTPAGIADSATGLRASMRGLMTEIQADATRREDELRRSAGLNGYARGAHDEHTTSR